jgi:hypothetical protein
MKATSGFSFKYFQIAQKFITYNQYSIKNMTLYIKYMGSLRCKMMVKGELKNLRLHYTNIDFGKGEIIEDITQEQHDLSRLTIGQVWQKATE